MIIGRSVSRTIATSAAVVFLSLPAGHAMRTFAEPDRPAAMPASRITPELLKDHAAALRQRVPEGFTVVVQSPFVVVGDESPAMVRRRAVDTVKWAVDRLKRQFFERDPEQVLEIWLFRDKDSYEKHTRQIFKDTPTTPFGYFSLQHRAMIMNIATGGGTLVHEIVHPFMHANFPECPVWFNEGLGSLYEQSADRDGRIQGLTNWRLAGLQRAIKAGKLPSFRELTAMAADRFYNNRGGDNYAQARYLCYYLQERGLLEEFYRRFRAGQADDPTGYATLQRMLNEPDMGEFQRKWERYVMGLRFGEVE